MKILQVANKIPYPTKDGGAIACMNLAKGFSLLGHDVTFLAMNTRKHNVTLDEIPNSVKELATFKLVDVPATINAFSALLNFVFSRQPYNAVRFITDRFARALEEEITTNKYDVIQLEGLYVCPYIPLIRKKTDALIVYRSHNIEYEIWDRAAEMSSGLRRFYLKNLSARIKRFERRLLNTYDVVVPITERDGEILTEMGNSCPLHVSQTGIDTSALFPSAKNLDYPSLFHIGSLEWAPNQEGLVWFIENCWPQLHKRYPNLKCYIAGRNAPPWLVKKFEVPNFVFLGEVADAYEFMNSKAIMLVPLFSGSGMRIKIIEGMALGKSIVSTPIGAEGIEVEGNKNILIAENGEKYINAVCRLIDDEQLFQEIGKNAIGFIHKKFDNLTAASELVEFYKSNL